MADTLSEQAGSRSSKGNSLRPPTIGWLRTEGAAILIVAVINYASLGAGWVLFGVLFFSPDLLILGYLAGPRMGAFLYNLAHTYSAPAILVGVAIATDASILLALATIWVAHIAFDRALGFGLKLPTGFKHTDLGSI